jgi:hypothetical protein
MRGMGKTLEEIDAPLRRWIAKQPMFFVASAPLDAEGHVNVSPKGPGGTFAVLGSHQVAYLDFFGSGAETVAHLRDNGRIVVMFCAFEGPPKIVRLHGRGRVVWTDEPEFGELYERAGFEPWTIEEARRGIVVVDVTRISKSCGYGVPLMDHVGEREHFDLSCRKRLRTDGAEAMRRRQVTGNATSIDGLPAVPVP